MDDGKLYRDRGFNQRGSAHSAYMKTEWAVTFGARMRGLLFRNPNDVALVLTPCRSVHTFGMKYPIDIAFIGRDGRVLRVFRSAEKRRRFKDRSAVAVIERFSSEGGGVWLKQGDYVGLGCCKTSLSC